MKFSQNAIFKKLPSQTSHFLDLYKDSDFNIPWFVYSLQRINDQFELSIYSLEKKIKLFEQISEKYMR